MKNHGFELPMPNGLKASSALDLDSIEQWMSDAESSAGSIGREVAAFARLAQLLLATGLSRNAVALLVQDLLPKTRRGNPTVTTVTILRVLDGASRLGEHLAPAKGKSK